jgi:hypothetical protein
MTSTRSLMRLLLDKIPELDSQLRQSKIRKYLKFELKLDMFVEASSVNKRKRGVNWYPWLCRLKKLSIVDLNFEIFHFSSLFYFRSVLKLEECRVIVEKPICL